MQFKIKILESNKQIESSILQALAPQVDASLSSIYKNLLPRIKELITRAIKNSPEYNSIVSGTLKYELGLPDGDRRVNELLNIWLSNINVTTKKTSITGSRITSGITIELIKADLSDVLGSEAAILVDSKTGSTVDWLNWLSLAGDTTIIKDYSFVLGSNPNSRTGGGIMRFTPGSGKWKVPSSFSGTITNNWITRSIDSISGDIESLIQNTLRESL